MTTGEKQRKSEQKDSIDLLILQPTPFCNIDCDYCYLANRSNPVRMSGSIINKTIEMAVGSGLVHERLSVVWHAGEPLAVPISFYRDAFERFDEHANGIQVTHSIQTNGTIIDQRWCDLFRERNVSVGVSVDGPEFLHDLHRKDRQGRGTHARVMKGIDHLRSNSIPFHAISVVTADALPHADEVFEFFASLGAFQVGFNIEELEGIHQSSTISGLSRDEVDRFFRRIYTLQQEAVTYLPIREFDQAYRTIANVSEARSTQGNQQNMAFAILSVDWKGNISTFSPELLGANSDTYENFCFGNVERDELSALLRNQTFTKLATAIQAGVEQCERQCDYFAFCGGGAPANKFYENGDFASAETMYCRHTIQLPLEIVLTDLESQLGISHDRRTKHKVELADGINLLEGISVSQGPRDSLAQRLVQIRT